MSGTSIKEQFSAFYEEYSRFIDFEARHFYSATEQKEDYNDCIQSVSEKLLEKAPIIVSLSKSQKILYIRSAVRNYYIDQARRSSHYKLCELDECIADKNGFALQFLKNEQSTILHFCISQMDEVSRSVIEMYYFSNLDCKEIGKRLSIRPGSVRTYLSRARKELKQLLKENGFVRD